jgi:UDP-glucose:(heptosyl)LPS alpha-1,3-glucosyltransferase
MVRGHEVHLLAHRWRDLPPNVICRPVGRLGGLSVLKAWSFARGAVRALTGERLDAVFNFERAPVRGIYVACEGCHREWLRVAAAHLPSSSRILRHLDPLHAFHLSVEQRIFSPEISTKIVAVSKSVRDDILLHHGGRKQGGMEEKNIEVVYMGIDLSEFSPAESVGQKEEIRKRFGVKPDEFVVLFIGSGLFRKGFTHLLRAVSILQKRGKPPRLLVVGRSARKSGALKTIRRLGIEGIVTFLGGNLETADVYRASDVFILPSLYEPFGQAALEGMGCGIPCIVSRRCGVSEILSEGEQGLILDNPVNAEEMAEKLLYLMDEGRRLRMSAAARKLAEQFPVSANPEQMLGVVRDIPANAHLT